MSTHVAWTDIGAEHVERAGGEAAGTAGKQALLADVLGQRLVEIARGFDARLGPARFVDPPAR